MQTSSKVDLDNWKDVNIGEIMNIRPVGTYTHCHPHPHHPHHPHHHEKPCCWHYNPYEYYHDNCTVDHDHHDPFHDNSYKPCPPMPHHLPVPPHHHVKPCPPVHPHHLVDRDGDGFIDGDVYIDVPHHAPEKPVCHHPHHAPVPPVTNILADRDGDGFIDSDIYVDMPEPSNNVHMHDTEEFLNNMYGTESPVSPVSDIVTEEVDNIIDEINSDDTQFDMPTIGEEEFEDVSDRDMNPDEIDDIDVVWTTSQMSDEAETPSEYKEIIVPEEKPASRRVNRGGRRKKTE